MERLAGIVGAVTFGGSAVGSAITGRVARAGATVVMIDPDGERTDAAAREIRKSWGTVAVHEIDPHHGDAAAVVADIVRTCGGLDLLVLLMDEAGAVAGGLVKAALPQMAARGNGMIVVADPQGTPRMGKLEEALSDVRRRLEVEHRGSVRCYGIASLPPGGGDLGSAIAHLAITRPEDEFEGRVILVPPV
jgi:NAD(P)-dependent dehydrogenase (short-subunit alcohol dehydrogenase family)